MTRRAAARPALTTSAGTHRMHPLVLTLLVAAAPQDAAGPKAIIEKAIKAHGGAANLDKYVGARATVKGTITAMGMDIAVSGVSLSKEPDKALLKGTISVAGMDIPLVQLVTPSSVVVSVAGQAQPLDDAAKEAIREGTYVSSLERLTPLVKGDTYTLKAGPDAAVDGKPAVGVVVESKGHKPVTLYFDKETGVLVKSTRTGTVPGEGEAELESFYKDYKAVQGVQVPHREVQTANGKPSADISIEKVELLEKVDDGEFVAD
jgi:hypothetical protein